MTRASSCPPAARPVSVPPPVGRILLTDEQRDILREASAYRFIHYTIGLGTEHNEEMVLEIQATPKASHEAAIWGPHFFGEGSFNVMNCLREAAMAEYNRLTKGSQ